MSRAGALLFALMVVQAALGALCVVAGRSEKNLAALHQWGWGLVIHAAGLFVLIEPVLPAPFGQIGGNLLIAISPIVSVTGVLLHSRIRLRLRWLGLGVVAGVLPILVNHVRSAPSGVVDALASGPVAIVVFLLAAWALVARPAARTVRSSRLVAAAIGLAAVTWMLRAATAWVPEGSGDGQAVAAAVLFAYATAQIVATVSATFGLLWIDVRRMGSTLERLVYVDPLTGLPNRRAALRRFADEVARALRHERTFALVLFEVDRFKSISDMRGPLACDAVLRFVADTMRHGMRAEDVPSHLGGNAFVVLLPEQTEAGAQQTCARLRAQVAATPCAYDAWPISVTVSGAVAVFPVDGANWEELFTVAGRRLAREPAAQKSPGG